MSKNSQNPFSNLSLAKSRLDRLKESKSKLGQPDLFSLVKIQTINSFLSQKKNVQVQEYFVVGLNFPTTAHISFFVNQQIRKVTHNKHDILYKTKLCVYDAYNQVDIQIQISVPGSLEMKGYNLNGQPVKLNPKDYEYAYYCSILRTLYTNNYFPNTNRFMQVQKYQVLANFIKSFVPFSSKNLLSYDYEDENSIIFDQQFNLGLEALIYYVLKNEFWDLADILCYELKKNNTLRYKYFDLQLKFLRKNYEAVVIQTAQELIDEKYPKSVQRKLKIYQIRSLIKLKRVQEVRILQQILVREGFLDISAWKQILQFSLENQENKNFIKLLNTCLTFVGEEVSFYDKIEELMYPTPLQENSKQKTNKNKCISNYSQLCFNFDQSFLQKYSQVRAFRQILHRTQKQKSTLEILQRLEFCLKKFNPLQKYLHSYQKIKGWGNLLQLRSQCFWLECDFVITDNHIQKRNNTQKSYRFLNESFIDNGLTQQLKKEQPIKERFRQQMSQQDQIQSYDDQLSDTESQTGKQSLQKLPPCSKRVNTKRIQNQLTMRTVQSGKILCNFALEKVFVNCYNFLKLQTDAQKWSSHLSMKQIDQISKQKKQLLSIIYLKKALLHKKLQRFRKAQQSFKLAYKCSTTLTTSLVACQMLIDLYLQHKSLKGMQYFTIQIVRLLWQFGIQTYDILPQWSRKVISFIIKVHGPDVIKTLKGPLRELVQKWLQIGTDIKKLYSKNEIKKE